MTDLNKVLKGFEYCSTDAYKCDKCPYIRRSVLNGHCSGYMEICADALELLKERQWIPVSRCLPPPYKRVLVTREKYGDKAMLVAWISVIGIWHPIGNDYVTHWMPLPEPPKEN